MPRRVLAWAALLVYAGAPGTIDAQRIAPHNRAFWIAGGLTFSLAVPFDERIRDFAARHQSPALDRIAQPFGDAGRAGLMLPALLTAMVVPRLLGNTKTSNAAIDIGLGYAVATGIGGILRPAIGRHRPDSVGSSFRFAPFRREHAWHSLPSGHMLGVMSVAAGLSIEARRPVVTTLAYGLASIVGLQRLYKQRHWASDVIAGTVLGIAASATTVRWRERQRS